MLIIFIVLIDGTMKRAHDNDSNSSQVRDGSPLGSRLQSDNNENELPETSIVEETDTQPQQQQQLLDEFQNKTIPVPVDAMITESAIVDERNTPKSNSTDGKINIIFSYYIMIEL